MSQTDRMHILKMIAEGKVTPEEGEELLGAVQPADDDRTRVAPPAPALAPSAPWPPAPPGSPRRKLIIEVHEDGEQRVNVSIPLSLAKVAARFIPRQAAEHLREYDINLDQLMQELANADGDGTLIQIQDDDSRVRIAVE